MKRQEYVKFQGSVSFPHVGTGGNVAGEYIASDKISVGGKNIRGIIHL